MDAKPQTPVAGNWGGSLVGEMVLHARGSGGVMALDRGRHRIPDARDRQTHERTILHADGGGHRDEAEQWKTSAMSSQDAHKLRRATRQHARRKVRDTSRNHHRCRGAPEDEEVALSVRREAQEDEWRRLLRRQRATARGIDLGSHASAYSSLLSSEATAATRTASKVTAGMRTEDVTWRQEDNGVAPYGRQCLALCHGDASSKQPLPLDAPVKANVPSAADYKGATPSDGLGRLGRLLAQHI